MLRTPNSNRKHIGIFGNTNSGKSSLMNRIVNQDISLVSENKGTTTDTVKKAMEIIGVGPVLFLDTAGLNDDTILGEKRIEKTMDALKKVDLSIFVIDGGNIDLNSYEKWKKEIKKYNLSSIIVVNKKELLSEIQIREIQDKLEDVLFISVKEDIGIDKLIDKIVLSLDKLEAEKSLIADILPYGSTVVMVVPIDSEAPKGRLILPQVQLIRDCLDNGIKSYVLRDTELEEGLSDIRKVDLVVTDSQAFKKVNKILPDNIPLTSFSILFARQKGDLDTFVKGAYKIKELKEGSKILIAESCSHNVSHEDIGKVKIPRLLEKYVGAKLDFTFRMGHDFPNDIEKYDLIIHCGACMINRKTVINRINECEKKEIPITNYGIVLAFLNGTLDRSISIFN